MGFKETIIERARSLKNKVLVLPESSDERILNAAIQIIKLKICTRVFLLGDEETIIKKLKELGLSKDEALTIINPQKDPQFESYINEYYELRKNKGLSIEEARLDMAKPVFFGTMMVRKQVASAMVAGALLATADVLRPALRIIGKAPGTDLISSCFVMETHKQNLGYKGQLIFSDCGIIPKPSTEELVQITLASARSCRAYLETEPIISLLSFSTKGSAEHAEVTRVRGAVEYLQKNYPDLIVDGEMQLDAAINEKTAKLKAPHSLTAGRSNTLIFPDLNSGNISYKAAQQFGDMLAYGPFVQGLASPINDLSRGCKTEEIIISAAASICQS